MAILSIYDFPSASQFPEAGVTFAVKGHAESIVAGLRKMANLIEKNELLLIADGVTLTNRAAQDDFVTSELKVMFCDRR